MLNLTTLPHIHCIAMVLERANDGSATRPRKRAHTRTQIFISQGKTKASKTSF